VRLDDLGDVYWPMLELREPELQLVQLPAHSFQPFRSDMDVIGHQVESSPTFHLRGAIGGAAV